MIGRGAFIHFAAQVAENGFTVIPTKGKVPVFRKWQNPKPTDLQWVGKVLASNRYADHNLGIVCGRVIGIDLDADDPLKVAQIETLAIEYLGPTPFHRVGRAPRTLLLYRPLAGEIISSMSKVGGCIDVLSLGKQFVAFGVHPDTGKPYQWIADNPTTAKVDDLPAVSGASVRAFTEAVCEAFGRPLKGVPAFRIQTFGAALQSRQRARQGELANARDGGLVRDGTGRVVDGREALLARLTAAEFAKRLHMTPDELGARVWALFIVEADLSRPKGSNPRQRWSMKDALAKARAICRRNPDLKPPRRSRGGHPASHLHAWRKPGFWTSKQRELHLTEIGRRIATPATLAVARIMIEAVDASSGFCTMPIAVIAKHARCSLKSVKAARATLRNRGLWIAGPRGVFIPRGGLNKVQEPERIKRKQVEGTSKVPPLYRIVVDEPSLTSLPDGTQSPVTCRPYQPDLFGAAVIDLNQYGRGLLPEALATAVRAEMRARCLTQDQVAGKVGISQPQLANALACRFDLSRVAAARLVEWLRRSAA